MPFAAARGIETQPSPSPAHRIISTPPRTQVDGCGNRSLYEQAYARMGAALEASGRDIVYSCSWPAYINASESEKPYGQMIMDGCNLWRNWPDIQCSPPPSGKGAVLQILDSFGDSSAVLVPWTGHGP